MTKLTVAIRNCANWSDDSQIVEAYIIIIIIIIITIIIIVIFISFMQGIYTYIPEKKESLRNTILQLFSCYCSWCLYL
jgi:nitrate/nitrite transporter NarK